MAEKLKLTKLDAAKRQIITALQLYFANGDPAATHTLAAAGHELVRGVSRARGSGPMLVKDVALDRIIPSYQKEYIRRINAPANFFKHADQDPDEEIDFDPALTEVLLFDATLRWTTLTGQHEPMFIAFQVYLQMILPDVFAQDAENAEWVASLSKCYGPDERPAFLAYVLAQIDLLRRKGKLKTD